MVVKRAAAPSPDDTGSVRYDRPQNGKEYLESLRDGREVYVYGDRVDDVTTHPAFRNTARMTARLFDALHDPARKDTLLLPTDELIPESGAPELLGVEPLMPCAEAAPTAPMRMAPINRGIFLVMCFSLT